MCTVANYLQQSECVCTTAVPTFGGFLCVADCTRSWREADTLNGVVGDACEPNQRSKKKVMRHTFVIVKMFYVSGITDMFLQHSCEITETAKLAVPSANDRCIGPFNGLSASIFQYNVFFRQTQEAEMMSRDTGHPQLNISVTTWMLEIVFMCVCVCACAYVVCVCSIHSSMHSISFG